MKLLLPLIIFGLCPVPAGGVDLVLGHFEYQLDYVIPEDGPLDEGWQASMVYDLSGSFLDNEGVVKLPLGEVRLLAAPSTRLVLGSPLPQFGTVNEPVWILSQNNIPGELFLGWRATYPQGLFQVKVEDQYSPNPLGSISSKFLGVEGTGPLRGGEFAMWTSSGFGALEFHFNTTDGVDERDELNPIPSGGHTHYNWGFTQPGTYQVRFRSEGKLNPQFGSHLTQAEAEVHFVVPHDGVLEGEAGWRLGSGANRASPVAIHDAAGQVDYAPDQVTLVASAGQFRLSAAGAAEVALGRVGLEPGAEIGFSGGGPVGVNLVRSVGPGEVTLAEGEEGVLLGFSSDGIYRVTLEASQGEVSGEPFVLTFLVNLPVDYGYADWADSFERTHRLVEGSLSDDTADWDQDGVGNGLEFLLFWHGLDPVVPDADKLPQPRFVDGRAEIEFLRDLHKDDFASKPLELAAAYSADLQSPWRPWRRLFAEGNADGFYEDGAERGNEISVVMRRKLVVPEASKNFGFFRFEQRSRN